MIQAWKRADGRYRLIPMTDEDGISLAWINLTAIDRLLVAKDGKWTCNADVLPHLKAEKVYGVIAGPSSCGCEPAMFRWVTGSEVEAGRTKEKYCPECNLARHPNDFVFRYHQCDIIDVCGEGDEGRAVYEAEFAAKFDYAV